MSLLQHTSDRGKSSTNPRPDCMLPTTLMTAVHLNSHIWSLLETAATTKTLSKKEAAAIAEVKRDYERLGKSLKKAIATTTENDHPGISTTTTDSNRQEYASVRSKQKAASNIKKKESLLGVVGKQIQKWHSVSTVYQPDKGQMNGEIRYSNMEQITKKSGRSLFRRSLSCSGENCTALPYPVVMLNDTGSKEDGLVYEYPEVPRDDPHCENDIYESMNPGPL